MTLFWAVVIFGYHGWPSEWIYPVDSKAEACAIAGKAGDKAVVYSVGDQRVTKDWMVEVPCGPGDARNE